MENKKIITDEEWQEIFDGIWKVSGNLQYDEIGYIEFKGNKYFFPSYFTDSIADDVYKEDNQAEYLDEDEIDEGSFSYWCRTTLVRDDKTVWYFYIIECGSNGEIDYFCGENYMDLLDNEKMSEEIQEIIEKI